MAILYRNGVSRLVCSSAGFFGATAELESYFGSNGIRIGQTLIRRHDATGGLTLEGGSAVEGATDYARLKLGSTDGVSGDTNVLIGGGVITLRNSDLSTAYVTFNQSTSSGAGVIIDSGDSTAQLQLRGTLNTGANASGKKLYISSYDNDGSTIYPIYCEDENNLVDFYIRNRNVSSGVGSLAYFAGNIGVNTTGQDRRVEINDSTGQCLRLTYNDSMVQLLIKRI